MWQKSGSTRGDVVILIGSDQHRDPIPSKYCIIIQTKIEIHFQNTKILYRLIDLLGLVTSKLRSLSFTCCKLAFKSADHLESNIKAICSNSNVR